MVNNKMNKEAKHTLDLALKVLEHAMDVAVEKEDVEVMIAISDRLMMLYQHLSDKNTKKFKTGFSMADPLIRKTDQEESETDDEESNY
jgi:hypothetical protein